MRRHTFFSSLVIAISFALAIGITSTVKASDLFLTDNNTSVDLVHHYDSNGALVSPDIPLLGATGLAFGPDGDLYVAATIPAQVFRYNPVTGAQIGSGPFVTFNGQNDGHDVQNPQGMRFGPNGNLYIADVTSSNVHIYSPTGASLGVLDSNGMVAPAMVQPTDVAFDNSGNIYVANSGEADVLRFTLTPAGLQQSVSEFVQTESGGLINPGELAFGPDGMLYVMDISNDDILRYTSSGAFDEKFINLDSPDIFEPADFVFEPDGKLYVSGTDLDTSAEEVLRFNADGSPDGVFVSSGLTTPTFMAFAPAVPEPASAMLLGAGAMGLLTAGVRRRRLDRQTSASR